MTEPPGWGAPPPDEPQDDRPQYGVPPPYQGGPPPGDPYTHWQGFSPPPGWTPPPKESMSKGELALGVASCLVLNLLLFFGTASVVFSWFGDGLGLVVLGLNIAAIVVPAVKGHKSFAVGFALGYVVMFVLALGACFLLIQSMN